MEVLDNRSAADAAVRDSRQQPVAPVMSVGEWMLTLLILALPLVNIIMLFVCAFGGGTNPTKANYCKASLIWIAIVIVLYVCFFSLIMGLFAAIQ